MIAVGKDGDAVVLFGSDDQGKLVQIRGSLDEGRAVLRQLAAVLGAEDRPVWTPPGPAPEERPAGPAPARHAPAPLGLIIDPGDAVREAQERDVRELASRANAGQAAQRIVRRSNEEEQARQETRRQRIMAASSGSVGGPVDE